MRRHGRRLPRSALGVVLALALGAPALAQATAETPRPGHEAAPDDAGDENSSCDPDGVATSFVIGHRAVPVVEAVVVTGLAPSCDGQTIEVVAGGRPGHAVAISPVTTVTLDTPAPADDVTSVAVSVVPPPAP